MKRNKLMIIDGNHLMHRAYNKFKQLKGPEGPTSVIFGFPHILQSLVRTHRPDELVVVFDGGKDKARLAILPEYKKRTSKSDFDYEDFSRQRKELKHILKALAIEVIHPKDKEADDIIWLLARRAKREKKFVEIVSSDKDFNQLIDKYIRVWNPYKNAALHYLNIEKMVGYTPEQCVDYLLLVGDVSDNIPGLKGIGDKRAKKFLNEYKSIKNYLDSLEEAKGFPRDIVKTIYDRRELIDIKYFCRKHKIRLKDYPSTKPKKQDISTLEEICRKHGIKTFTKKQFYKTFNNG